MKRLWVGLVIVLAIALGGMSYAWFEAKEQALASIDANIAELRAEGFQVDRDPPIVSGYPLNLRLTVENMVVSRPDGARIEYPPVRMTGSVFAPDRFEADLSGRYRLSLNGQQETVIDIGKAVGDALLADGRISSFNLDLAGTVRIRDDETDSAIKLSRADLAIDFVAPQRASYVFDMTGEHLIYRDGEELATLVLGTATVRGQTVGDVSAMLSVNFADIVLRAADKPEIEFRLHSITVDQAAKIVDGEPSGQTFEMAVAGLTLPEEGKVQVPLPGDFEIFRISVTEENAVLKTVAEEDFVAWQAAGGRMIIQEVRFKWGDLDVVADGTFELDDALRPEFSAIARIKGMREVFAAAQQASPDAAQQMMGIIMVVAAVAEQEQVDGKPVFKVTFAAEDGRARLGANDLGAVPPITVLLDQAPRQ